jgi:LmbE family N-acetylglucosaminyl deacetylase
MFSTIKFRLREFICKCFYNYFIKRVLGRFLDLTVHHAVFEVLPRVSSCVNSKCELPRDESVLIIAPHPDDELIGLGGTIQLLRERNCSVHVVYVTTGHKDKKDKIKKEAISVCSLLGIQYTFLSNNPGEINLSEGLKLEKIVRDLKVRHLYTTFIMDDHDDHKRVNQLIFPFVRDVYKLKIWMYQIYTSLPTNCVVDITEVANQKYKALSQYINVKGDRDWVHYSKGCDARMSRFLKDYNALYAESFLVMDSRDYYDACSIFFSNNKELIYKTKVYLK